MKFRLAGLVLVILIASACTSLPQIPVTEQSRIDWEKYQRQSESINSWDLHARAVVFVEDEVYHVGLNWHSQPQDFVMILEAPFGQGVFRLESNHTNHGYSVKLSLPDGRVVFGDNAEKVLQTVLGWSIPVSGLKSWIKGLPRQSAQFEYDLNGDGRLKSMQQNGWFINYLDYFEFESPERGLPRKMYLKHDSLALKLVIERWQAEQIFVTNPDLFPDFN